MPRSGALMDQRIVCWAVFTKPFCISFCLTYLSATSWELGKLASLGTVFFPCNSYTTGESKNHGLLSPAIPRIPTIFASSKPTLTADLTKCWLLQRAGSLMLFVSTEWKMVGANALIRRVRLLPDTKVSPCLGLQSCSGTINKRMHLIWSQFSPHHHFKCFTSGVDNYVDGHGRLHTRRCGVALP